MYVNIWELIRHLSDINWEKYNDNNDCVTVDDDDKHNNNNINNN
jgi:hypothetical protein